MAKQPTARRRVLFALLFSVTPFCPGARLEALVRAFRALPPPVKS